MSLEKKTNKGITLIALVITIIVLLILAGVTISALSGDNGILQRATEAKEKTQNANIEEQRQLTIMEAITNTKETTYKNVTIPAGMAVSQVEGENTLEKGLVAIDKKGNEWVWIEVPKTTVFKTATASDQYNNIKADLIAYATDYREGKAGQGCKWTDEWYAIDGGTLVKASTANDKQKALNNGCGLNYAEYDQKYKKMLSSVYTNGGFWIGRYEAGVSDTKPRTAEGEITGLEAKSQPDMYPFNFVTCSQAQTLASAMSTDSSKTSSLMFGIQWDLVCKYLEGKDGLTKADINSDSTNWGNYNNIAVPITSVNAKQSTNYGSSWSAITESKAKNSSIILSTAASNNTKKMNIYDFAGNEWEWTLEKTSGTYSPCADRGGGYGNFGSNYPASYRDDFTPSDSRNGISFRPSLY